jgi:L-ascorbate metabolism protein UlaG (beta-lactamase superfamily)
MEIVQIRNATILLRLAEHRLLVDPMLGEPGTLPAFHASNPHPNPLVPLPEIAGACLDETTGVIVTHEHPDHLDPPAIEWIRSRSLPVWASPVDVPSLRRQGLDARPLADGALGMRVEVTACAHGRGLLGFRMGPAAGFFVAHPDEPSVYLTGDTVLTRAVLEALERLCPELTVAPAGAANFGTGGDILFSVDELAVLAERRAGALVLNHLEALDHCPTKRQALRARFADEIRHAGVFVPDDGETLAFRRDDGRRAPGPLRRPRGVMRRRLQKRVKRLLR